MGLHPLSVVRLLELCHWPAPVISCMYTMHAYSEKQCVSIACTQFVQKHSEYCVSVLSISIMYLLYKAL
jgi:hypothetical protein